MGNSCNSFIMSIFKVNIKHNKNTYKDVLLDTSESALQFKAQIYALTNVPPDAQKILVKGGKLKDDHDWKKLRLKDGHQFIVMGKPDDVAAPQIPQQKTVFVEDLAEEEHETHGELLPNGLVNLGNTCYMNSVLQCFKSVPELRTALKNFNGGQTGDAALASALGAVMNDLDAQNVNKVIPFQFINRLRQNFPQFDEKVEGRYAQQDAEECWTSIISSLKRTLPAENGKTPIANLFEGEFKVIRRNTELSEAEEKPAESQLNFLKLRLPISNDTRYITECLKESMRGVMEKRSDVAGRDCQYEEISRISKLPFYLTLQFVRFRWKAKNGSNAEGNKAKVLRPVEFPLHLDMQQWCVPELQEELKVGRAAMKEIEDRRILSSGSAAKKAKTDGDAAAPAAAASAAVAMETDSDDPLAGIEMPRGNGELQNDTAVYDLHAVVTHKGRDADGGHYVAWVKEKENCWLLFDDDDVSVVDDEAIKRLAGTGGADWHIAYVMVYKARTVKDLAEKAREQLKQEAKEDAAL